MVLATSVNIERRLSSVHKDKYHQVDETQHNEFAYCQRLASQISNAQDLPAMCRGFPSIIDTAKSQRQSFRASTAATVNPIHVPRGMARSRLFRRESSGGWRDV